MTFYETLKKCKEFGFSEETTRATLWNEAYRLGRSRWYWGPDWFVNFVGRFNTVKQRLGL